MKVVRKARSSDVDELARLSFQLGYPISRNELEPIFAQLDADPDHAFFVIEKEPTDLVGYVHIFLTRRLFLTPFAELGGLVVDDQYRGMSLGSDLLQAAEHWAQAQGIGELRVRSNVLREGARDFYLKHGFDDRKKQTVFYKSISM
jgi:GNAT superfamily N-acetyltransferase